MKTKQVISNEELHAQFLELKASFEQLVSLLIKEREKVEPKQPKQPKQVEQPKQQVETFVKLKVKNKNNYFLLEDDGKLVISAAFKSLNDLKDFCEKTQRNPIEQKTFKWENRYGSLQSYSSELYTMALNAAGIPIPVTFDALQKNKNVLKSIEPTILRSF